MSDSMGTGGPDLQAQYESLRGHATDQQRGCLPQGLALLLRSGLPAWIGAWAQVTSHSPVSPPPHGTTQRQPAMLGREGELVTVLATMVLASQRKE